MLWLCIRFPKLPLEAFTRAQTPRERSQPLAIVENEIIEEPNQAAFKSGVISGLSIASARNICPGLQIVHRDREREQRQLEELAQWGFSYTPMVSVKAATVEDIHPPHLYLELSNCLNIQGGLRSLLNQLQQELTQMDIAHCQGLGHSPSAALLLSQLPEHRQWLQQTPYQPTPKQLKYWISHAPSKLLGCDNRTIEELYSRGFKRVSQLLTTPLSEIEACFGYAFLDYLARLSSSLQKPIYNYQPQTDFDGKLFLSKPPNKNIKSQKLIKKLKERLGHQAFTKVIMKQITQNHYSLEYSTKKAIHRQATGKLD
ncbi:Y-family DNA polymerase [Microbulbifer sp. CnH-101-E]|uniref:Y-family DNA polymerase n=1 Tax=unclassified Microbulbifer TaxID=2619833 RepID=UPI00403A7033